MFTHSLSASRDTWLTAVRYLWVDSTLRSPPVASLSSRSLRSRSARRVERSQLGDVAELELNGSLASEDVHEHLELRAVDVDLADDAVEVREWPGDDAHLLADFVLEPRPHLLLGRRALF